MLTKNKIFCDAKSALSLISWRLIAPLVTERIPIFAITLTIAGYHCSHENYCHSYFRQRIHRSWAVFVVDYVIVYFLSLFTFRYRFLSVSCYWRPPPYIYLTLPHIFLPFVTLPCTLPYVLPYILHYLTLPYLLPYILPCLTLHLSLPYLLPYILPYLTLPYFTLTLPHLTSYLTFCLTLPNLILHLTLVLTLPDPLPYLTLPYEP